GADDGDALVGLARGLWRTPAAADCLVGDRALDGADADCAETFLQGADAFAEAVMRADAAADFRQRIGFVHQGCGILDATLAGQFQPLRNAVAERAAPRAIRVAAIDATRGLVDALTADEIGMDLAEIDHADGNADFAGQGAGEFEERKRAFAHAASRSSADKAARLAAFGL